MKKLTKLLLSISSISGIASFAVSCSLGSLPGANNNGSSSNGNGTKPETGGNVDPNGGGNGVDPQGDFKNLIDEFKKDVNNTINSHLNENISNLYELDEGDGKLKNQFLNLSVLKTKQKPFGEQIDFTDGDKINLKEDAAKLIVLDSLNTLIKKVLDNEKYKILKPDTDSDIILDIIYKSCAIAFTESEQITAANVVFDYNISLNYKDFSNNISLLSFENRFIYGITNSKKVTETVNNLFNSLRIQGVLDDKKHNDIFKINHEKLGLIAKKQNWITEEKYNSLLKNYINGDSFKKIFVDDLNKNYKLENNVEFKFSQKIDEKESFESYNNLTQIKGVEESINWKSNKKINNDYNTTNVELYDFLFRENKITSDSSATIGGDKSYLVNNKVYEYLKNTFPTIFVNNNENVANLLKINKNEVKDKENLKNNVRVGELSIKNLQLKIGSNFVQQLPNLKVLTSFSSDENNKSYNLASAQFNQDFFDNSDVFASVYKNTILGIRAMKDVYGFTEDNSNKNFVESNKNYNWKGLSMSNFKGITNNWTNGKNLWDSFNYKNLQTEIEKNLSNNLSLKNSNQSDYLKYILNSGEQEFYNWSVDFNGMKFRYIDWDNQKGVSVFGGNTKKFYGNLKMNFLNIKYEIDEQFTSQPSGASVFIKLMLLGKDF